MTPSIAVAVFNILFAAALAVAVVASQPRRS